MKNNIVFNEIDSMINDDIYAIIIVGSFLKKENPEDIDLFIIDKSSHKQRRVFKEINGLKYDINFFSLNLVNKLIEQKTYFLISQLKDGQIYYEKEDIKKIIEASRFAYEEGPNYNGEEIIELQYEIKDLLELIRKEDSIEKKYFESILIQKLIDGYFKVNNKWKPKEKKVFKYLEKEDQGIYNDIKENIHAFSIENIESIKKCIFKE